MPLGDVRAMLAAARRRRRAVGSFNVFNLETIEAVLGAARVRRSPAIVAFTERLAEDFDLETLALVVRHRAAGLEVPIGLTWITARARPASCAPSGRGSPR